MTERFRFSHIIFCNFVHMLIMKRLSDYPVKWSGRKMARRASYILQLLYVNEHDIICLLLLSAYSRPIYIEFEKEAWQKGFQIYAINVHIEATFYAQWNALIILTIGIEWNLCLSLPTCVVYPVFPLSSVAYWWIYI